MKTVNDDIKNEDYKGIYLFYGEENFLKEHMTDSLVKAIIPEENSMNLSVYDGKIDDFNSVLAEMDTLPFLSDKRVLLFKNSEIFTKAENELVKSFAKLPEYCVLIFMEDKVDKRTAAFKKAKKYERCIEFSKQDRKYLSKWVTMFLSKEGFKIRESTMDYFLSVVGDDMTNIRNELLKLVSSVGDSKEITKKDIDSICIPVVENRIFEMVSNVSKGKKNLAYRQYNDLLLLREAPVKILYLMNREYNVLIQVKKLKAEGKPAKEIASILKMNPFIVSKVYYNFVDSLSLDYLKRMLSYGVGLDYKIKTGLVEDKTAVELFIAAS